MDFDPPSIVVPTTTPTMADTTNCVAFRKGGIFLWSISRKVPEPSTGACIDYFSRTKINSKPRSMILTSREYSRTALSNNTRRIQRKCELRQGTNEATGVFRSGIPGDIHSKRTPSRELRNHRLLSILGVTSRLQRSSPNYNRPWLWNPAFN